jgi:hypothetical protein
MKNRPNPSSAKLLPFLTLSLLASACLLVAISIVPAAGQAPAQPPAAPPAQTQDKTPASPPAPAQPAAAVTAVQNPAETHAETHTETHKDQIAADSAKLFQLANELKAEMDKSTKDTLSLSVMKKAEEVEKLAHKVRDEMRASLSN